MTKRSKLKLIGHRQPSAILSIFATVDNARHHEFTLGI